MRQIDPSPRCSLHGLLGAQGRLMGCCVSLPLPVACSVWQGCVRGGSGWRRALTDPRLLRLTPRPPMYAARHHVLGSPAPCSQPFRKSVVAQPLRSKARIWGFRENVVDQPWRSKARIWGTWCSGITSVPHAEGPGLKSQCVHAPQWRSEPLRCAPARKQATHQPALCRTSELVVAEGACRCGNNSGILGKRGHMV